MFSIFKKKPAPEQQGVLVVVFGEDPIFESIVTQDRAILEPLTNKLVLARVSTESRFTLALKSARPEVLYLIGVFNDYGALEGSDKRLLPVARVMSLVQQLGIKLFITAAENDFQTLASGLKDVSSCQVMVVNGRNRHYPEFLQGLLERMGGGENFPQAYAALAPQNEEAQKGRPLPGTIAICPDENGRKLILWSNPQP